LNFIDQITVLILTFNEAPNIGRILNKLSWAKRILIVDSGSTDSTIAIVCTCPQAEIVRRNFDDFAQQCNFGLSHISSEWVLSLDADYELTDELIEELRRLNPNEDVSGYRASFIYNVYGRPLRAALYPPRTVLYRRRHAEYRNEGHGHRVSISGNVGQLRGRIVHDDRKPLSRWFSSQQRYAVKEADYLLGKPERAFTRVDRIRRLGWPAPVLVFFYTLFVKACIFDGWEGWLYTVQRTIAELLIALEIIDRRLQTRHQQYKNCVPHE
jgi:glycosyltransferase involved in cell wall biosynthesis